MRAASTAWLVLALALPVSMVIADDAGTAPSPMVRWERPPAGTLERGALGVPEWVVVASGSVVVLGSAVALALAVRRARRGAQR